MQVGAVALEELVRGEREENVEVAARTAAQAGLALAREADTRAVFDARRDVDRQGALTRDAAGAGAGGARVVDHLAAAVTRRTSAFEGEEALGVTDFSLAVAGRAGLRLAAGLGARARAGLADHRSGEADLRLLAAERLLERDLHVVAQVGAALAAAGTAAAPAAHAEEVVENVGKR